MLNTRSGFSLRSMKYSACAKSARTSGGFARTMQTHHGMADKHHAVVPNQVIVVPGCLVFVACYIEITGHQRWSPTISGAMNGMNK